MNACMLRFGKAALTVLSVTAGSANALIITDARTSGYVLSGLSGNFSGAVAGYNIAVTGGADGPTPVSTVPLQTKSEAVGVSVSGSGAFITNVTNQTATQTDIELSAAAAGSGRVDVGYSTGAADDFAKSWIARGAEPGFATLRFLGGGTGFVPMPIALDDGIARVAFFEVVITLEGDWSSIGSGAGQLQFSGIDPAWVIDQFFQYDAIGNVTRFHAANSAYTEEDALASRTANVDFTLRLPAVLSAPAVPGMLLTGLAGMMLVRRRG